MEQAIDLIRRQRSGESLDAELLEEAVETVVVETMRTYDRISATYVDKREEAPWSRDQAFLSLMLALVRERIEDGDLLLEGENARWRLLDVGAGYGRDVARLAGEDDCEPWAVDNSKEFISLLRRLEAEGRLNGGRVVEGDMRELSALSDGYFHCVRNHATLHHLPAVGAGIGLEQAVAESRRLLKPGGVFYVLTKAGSGVELVDTHEGLGGRFYQLLEREELEAILTRNGFALHTLTEETERRGSADVRWLFALATVEV